MKFALVDGARHEAQPGLLGTCPACERPLVAKCGEVRIWHWAHRGQLMCDPWWENEGPWHRAWKSHFPESWQEIVLAASDGTRHIADVRTDRNWVLEFQHSHLQPEERRARDAFYRQLIWVVDATRRKRDITGFSKAWGRGVAVDARISVKRVQLADSGLLREWARSQMPIFFDFGMPHVIWWLLPGRPEGAVYIIPFSRAEFLDSHRLGASRGADFDALVNELVQLIAGYERRFSRRF
jgi:competence protein CoiA